MIEVTNVLQEIGRWSLSSYWFPLLIWSIFALMVHACLKWTRAGDLLYRYHLRIALIIGIPLGVLVSGSSAYLSGFFSRTAETANLSFIIIQNPITVTSAPETSSINWGDPYIWISCITIVITVISIIKLIQTCWRYACIASITSSLVLTRVDQFNRLNGNTWKFQKTASHKIFIAFSEEAKVPFTFGWKRPVIVIPKFLREQAEKLYMAVRHELIHIKRKDFLTNSFVSIIKSLFWFHPLVHLFDKELRDLREISCDSEVVADRSISPKKYAQLLYELAPKKESFSGQVVSMSVRKSSLQKRIKILTESTASNKPVLRSVVVSISLLATISGVIACTDLQTSSITNNNLQIAQEQIQSSPDQNQPLYIINDETATKTDFENLNPESIESIYVLEDEEEVQQYGDAGKNGVIIVTLRNNQEVSPPPSPTAANGEPDNSPTSPSAAPPPPTSEENGRDFFVVVEEMPSLIGGLSTLQGCIQYPEPALTAGIEGRVIVQFIVNERGQVENPRIVRGIGGGADEEALRCARQVEFEPGRQRGMPVAVQYSLPVVFQLRT